MNTEEKKVEINGDNPEYGENAKEILNKVINGEICDYILMTNNDEKRSLIVNIGSQDFDSVLNLDDMAQRAASELRNRINGKLLSAVTEIEKVKQVLTMHVLDKDGDMLNALKSKLNALNSEEEGGADE